MAAKALGQKKKGVNVSEKPVVEMFVDGACRGNPGPGGWGVLLKSGEKEKELTGYDAQTTNNRMELMAAIQGLKALKEPTHVALYTDSTYVKDGMTLWIHTWKKNQWRTANKTPVKNQDLWQELDALTQHHSVQWFWIKGHNGHPGNERADFLARNALVQSIMRHEMTA